jgi:hypothetical protein
MKLELTCDGPDAEGRAAVRLVVVNDSYEPVTLDRRLLFGPHPGSGDPLLLSSEPASRKKSENLVLLNPWTLYGRERRFQYEAGEITFHGFLLRRPADTLQPQGPGDPEDLLAAAPPLVVAFGPYP